MSLIVLLAFIGGVSPNIIWPCFSLVTHEWLLFSHSPPPPLFCSLSAFSLLSSLPPLCCHLCNVVFSMFCETLHCSRLNYNLDVADRLADEHVLIHLYVNLLQNNPKTWLVGALLCLPNTAGNYVLC